MKLRRTLSAALLGSLCLTAAPALAQDRFRFDSDQGVVTIEIRPDGTVHGFYPEKDGRITGRVDPDGTIRGFWLQSSADYACRSTRYNTRAWGVLVISSPYRDRVRALYGYCDEPAAREWQINLRR